MSNKKITQIGVWGSYHYGNFGDDLMALIYAHRLATEGFEPVIFSANPALTAPFTYKTIDSITNWNSDDATVVMGGGAMLSGESFLRFVARPVSRKVNHEFRELNAACSKHRLRVIPISIGGDGMANASIFGARHRFFKAGFANLGTVRLRGDRELLTRQYQKDYPYFPDVLFATKKVLDSLFTVKRCKPDKFTIGLNVHTSKGVELAAALKKSFPGASVVNIGTHSSFYPGNYEYQEPNSRLIDYSTLPEFIADLAGLSVIVSDKLHVGLVGAVYGVPFVSYQAKSKTIGLHRELGLEEVVCQLPSDVIRVLKSLDSEIPQIQTLATRIPADGLDEQALGHFQFLRSALDQSK